MTERGGGGGAKARQCDPVTITLFRTLPTFNPTLMAVRKTVKQRMFSISTEKLKHDRPDGG